MFIPIGDDNRDRRTTPIVNYLFILINILVFIFLQDWGRDVQFTYGYSTVPAEILSGHDIVSHSKVVIDEVTGQRVVIPGLEPTPINVYLTLISSMFMHGGLAHILGNMLFLWIFGDNLENLLGHVRYAIFYVVCGLAAAIAQIVMDTDSIIPMLGASGAISGVLGGYILLFPQRQVRAIIFNFLTTVPAFVAIGIWIVYQLVLGYLTDPGTGGVAYMAHIGGFLAGIVLIKPFAIGRRV